MEAQIYQGRNYKIIQRSKRLLDNRASLIHVYFCGVFSKGKGQFGILRSIFLNILRNKMSNKMMLKHHFIVACLNYLISFFTYNNKKKKK